MAVLDFLKGIFKTKDPADVTQSDIVSSVRQAYPQFSQIPDQEIVAKVVARNPDLGFLSQYEPDKPIPPELVPKPLRTPKFYDMNQDVAKADATDIVTQFKEKYPVYKDVDNVRLAQALEKKFPTKFQGLGNRLNEPITPPSENDLGTKPLAQEPPAPRAPAPDASPNVGVTDKVNQMIKELPSASPDEPVKNEPTLAEAATKVVWDATPIQAAKKFVDPIKGTMDELAAQITPKKPDFVGPAGPPEKTSKIVDMAVEGTEAVKNVTPVPLESTAKTVSVAKANALKYVDKNASAAENKLLGHIMDPSNAEYFAGGTDADALAAGVVELGGIYKGITGGQIQLSDENLKALKERKVSPDLADAAGQIVGGVALMAGVGAAAEVKTIAGGIDSFFSRTPEVARYLKPIVAGGIEFAGADSIREGIQQVKSGELDITRFGKVLLHGAAIGAGGGMFGGFTNGIARVAGAAAFGAATTPSDDPKEVAINAGIWGSFAATTAKEITEAQRSGAYQTARENIKTAVESEAKARGYTPEDSGKIVGATLDAFDGTIDKFGGIKNVKVRDFEKASREIYGKMNDAFDQIKPYIEAPKQIPTGGTPPPQASPDGFGPSGEAPPLTPAQEVPPEPPAGANRTAVTPEQFDRYFAPMDTPGEKEAATAFKDALPAFQDAYQAELKKQNIPPNVISADAAKTVEIPGWEPISFRNTIERQRIGSAAAGAMYENALKDPQNAGKPVIITSGISGAGKTSGLKFLTKNISDYAAIFDTNLANLKNGQRIIDKTLESDPQRAVQIQFVNRDPIEAYIDGVYPRYLEEGRMVTVPAHVGYMNSKNVVGDLIKIYKDNPRVTFRFVDNYDGKLHVVDSFDKLKDYGYTQEEVRRTLNDFLTKEHETGDLSKEELQAALGQDAGRTGGQLDQGDGGWSQQALRQEAGQTPAPQEKLTPEPTPPTKKAGAKGGIVSMIIRAGRINPTLPESSDIRELGYIHLMSKKSKIGLDSMTERAIQEGFLPRGSTPKNLLELIQQEKRTGQPAVRIGDESLTPEQQAASDATPMNVGDMNLKPGDTFQFVQDGKIHDAEVASVSAEGNVKLKDDPDRTLDVFDKLRVVNAEKIKSAEPSSSTTSKESAPERFYPTDVKKVFETATPADLDKFWGAGLTEKERLDAEAEKRAAPLIEQMNKLKGKREKAAASERKKLKEQIEEIQAAPEAVIAQLEAEQMDFVEKLSAHAMEYAKSKGLDLSTENAKTAFSEDFLNTIFDRPGIEWSWKIPLTKIVDGIVDEGKAPALPKTEATTAGGEQTLIPGTPGRAMPEKALEPKKAQVETHQTLEGFKPEIPQDELFQEKQKRGGNSESLGARGSEIIDNFEKVPAVASDQPTEKELKLFDRYREIAKEFTTRIGERYVTSKNEGEFFPNSGTVRVRALNNASVLIHEISHAIDAKEKIVEKVLREVGQTKDGKAVYDPKFKKLRKELTDVYVQYYPTGKKDHPLKKRMTEGYATFIQKFHEQPSMIAQKFPVAVHDILDQDGPLYSATINELIRKMNEVTREYQKQDALYKVGSKVTSKNAQDEIKDSYLNFWEKFYTQTMDEVYPIEKLAEQTGNVRTEADPSLWLRQYNNVNHIIFNNFTGHDGFWVLHGDEFKKVSEKNIGDLLDRLQKRGLVDDFGYYLVARDQHFGFLELDKLRGPALEAAKFLKELEDKREQLAGGFILDAALKKDIAEAKKKIEAFKRLDAILKNNAFDRAVVTEAYEKNKSMFENEEKLFDTFTRGNLDILNTAHLIRPKQYAEFTGKQGYAPLKRDVFDEILGAGEGRLPDLKAGNTRVSSMISRKGSQLTILNPLYSLLRDHAEIYRKALKQVVFNKIGDLAIQLPDVFHKLKLVRVVDKNTGKISYPQDRDKNIVMARRADGERVPYLTNREVKGVIDDLLDFHNVNALEDFMRFANRTFTKGTTAAYPLFAFTNFVVDQFSAAANTRNAFIPIYDPLAKALKATLSHGSPEAKFYKEYLSLAGEQQTFAHWQDLPPDELFSKINGERSALRMIGDFLEKGYNLLTIPAAKSEIWTRAAEYVKSRMAGNPQVVALEDAGRVSAPFHHLGQWGGGTFGKTMIRSVPFMNPGIQAAAQYLRSLAGNDGKTRSRAAFVTLALVSAMIGSLVFLMKRASDEQKKLYKELEPNELAGYLWLPYWDGKSLLKFKVPAEIGVSGTLINMMLADYMLGAKYTVKDYVSGATAWMPDQINFTQPIRQFLSSIPQLLKPAINVLYGKKDWPAVRSMESRTLESKEPRFRFNENTSTYAKWLGNKFNLSPIKIDYLIEGYIGRVSRFFTGKTIPNPFVREWYFTSGRTLEDYFDQKDQVEQAINALKNNSRKVSDEEEQYLLARHGEIKVIDKYLEIYRKLNDEFKAGRIKTNDDLIQLRTQILDRIDTFRAIKPKGKTS